MSTEIKIVHHPINQAVSTLKRSSEIFETSFPDEVKGENQLEMLEQINYLNSTYASLIKTYQTLILEHLHATEGSIETIKETDQSLANTLSYLK